MHTISMAQCAGCLGERRRPVPGTRLHEHVDLRPVPVRPGGPAVAGYQQRFGERLGPPPGADPAIQRETP
jgi:hypothetical protein